MKINSIKKISFIMVVVFLTTTLFPFLEISAVAATNLDNIASFNFRDTSTSSVVNYLRVGQNYNLSVSFSNEIIPETTKLTDSKLQFDYISDIVELSEGWSTKNSSEKITLNLIEYYNSNNVFAGYEIRSMKIDGIINSSNNRLIEISFTIGSDKFKVSGYLQDSFFDHTNNSYNSSSGTNSGNNNTTDGEKTGEETSVGSNILLEKYIVTDSEGVKISEINKSTKPFNLTISYLEYGLKRSNIILMSPKDFSVYLVSPGGLISSTGTNGTIEKMTNSANGIPRFKVSFTGLTYDEAGGNIAEMQILYKIDGTYIEGKLPITISQAKAVSKDGEDKEIPPLKPYIIINNYSYGDNETIVAGDVFQLDIDYKNTSSATSLENIVMTITPPEDSIVINSSSNTKYIQNMAPSESGSHSIELKALPNSKVGSSEITIAFSYQYTDSANKSRIEVPDLTQKISIPVSQLDRFSVDDISVSDVYATVGETFYIPVSFLNRGKSITYNITATGTSKSKIDVMDEHFGNLESGKSNSLELAVVSHDVGEIVVNVAVQYEDENNLSKEKTQSVTVFVQEPYIESFEEQPNPNELAEPEIGFLSIALFLSGSIFIAAPLGFYIIKRFKLKSEEGDYIDEDF